jgi:hypothetical protein
MINKIIQGIVEAQRRIADDPVGRIERKLQDLEEELRSLRLTFDEFLAYQGKEPDVLGLTKREGS